jgi:hypothetical protein
LLEPSAEGFHLSLIAIGAPGTTKKCCSALRCGGLAGSDEAGYRAARGAGEPAGDLLAEPIGFAEHVFDLPQQPGELAG